MRTLVIAGEYPWPENTRVADPVGHGAAGPATVRRRPNSSRSSPSSAGVRPPRRVVGPGQRGPGGIRQPFAVDPRPPARAAPAGHAHRTAPAGPGLGAAGLGRFMSGRYDLVWFFGPRPWVLTGKPVFAPTVLDLDRLGGPEDHGPAGRSRPAGHRSVTGRIRRAAARMVSEEEIRRLAPTAPPQQPACRRHRRVQRSRRRARRGSPGGTRWR